MIAAQTAQRNKTMATETSFSTDSVLAPIASPTAAPPTNIASTGGNIGEYTYMHLNIEATAIYGYRYII